ncbi:MAG: hypothetical protein EXR21_02245 [Flavobacteriaceae bacterium]|nr:hypothetical protein [Flavobacteriaceae bacterium]
MSKDIRIVKDSLILGDDVEIGKISEWQAGDTIQRKFVISKLNGKPIGDVFVNDLTILRSMHSSESMAKKSKCLLIPA